MISSQNSTGCRYKIEQCSREFLSRVGTSTIISSCSFSELATLVAAALRVRCAVCTHASSRCGLTPCAARARSLPTVAASVASPSWATTSASGVPSHPHGQGASR